jgi:hypothetical protein
MCSPLKEQMAIREKVKKYIAKRNAREGAGGSGSGDMEAPATPTTEVPTGDDTGAPADSVAQDGVQH